jgi:two-component system nitrate/nitrite response regulator NarL
MNVRFLARVEGPVSGMSCGGSSTRPWTTARPADCSRPLRGACVKLLVIDDHPVVLEGLVALLRHSEPSWSVLQAQSAADGLDILHAHESIAVVLLDLAMPGLSGVDAIDAFRNARPDLAIIVISARETAEEVRQALAHGARGFIPKSSRPQTLLAAVRLVLGGEIYVPPAILATEAVQDRSSKLTPRQLEILDALSEGRSNKDIAVTFGLSEKTVKAHISAIFRALGVVNRTQAAAARRVKGAR